MISTRSYPRGRSRILTRVAARVRHGSLDRALLRGEDPASSKLLAERAAALNSPDQRASLARGIDSLLGSHDAPRRRIRAMPDRDAVRANEQALREIAALLRYRSPMYAPGLARMTLLVTDALGPLYHGGPEALADELSQARRELAGGPGAATSPRMRPAGRVRGGAPATRAQDAVAMQRLPVNHRRHEAA
jgi:hypothetical protein